MFLLSAGNGGDFSDADRDAVRAVTEAGVAALAAEINSSQVQQVSGLVLNERLREAAGRDDTEEESDDPEEVSLSQILSEATEDLRVRTSSDVTVAVVDGRGRVLAANGIAESSIPDVLVSETYRGIPPTEEGVFSITLGGDIHVAKVTKAVTKDRRLVAVDKLDLGAGSLLRRVLGSETPAGLVRKGKMVGDIIGDQPITDEIESIAGDHSEDVPDEGASAVFTMGSGLNKRIGALGRVPGPAGRGDGGAMLVVMSRETAAASQQDVAAALSEARRKGVRVNWVMLSGLLLLSAALAVYLPYLEGVGPLRRLTREFEALAVGQQHQIFHDRYSGPPGMVARAAAGAYEALRQAFLAELEIEDDGVEDEEPRPRPRTSRQRRLTRAHQKLGETGDAKAAPAPRKRQSRSAPRLEEASAEPEPQPEPEPAPQQLAPTAPAPSPPRQPTPRPPAPAAPAPAPTPIAPAAPSFPTPRAPEPPAPRVPAPPLPSPEPTPAPVVPAPAVASPATDDDARYEDIFEEFVQVKQACGEPTDNLTFDRFAAKLRKNERDLKKKRPNIKDVQFSVYVKDGKAALKAKVIK